MDKSELQHFAGQLSVWAELVIEHGRTPFRRVELFPKLHTRLGLFHPPLVFWINRQSLMAGGIVLLPDADLAEQLEFGAACAEALGIRHFVTWEKDRIRIWDAEHAAPRVEKELTVSGTDPDSFRTLLLELMDELKLLSVLGMVPPEKLTPGYLHNLFQETLETALGPIVTSFRESRAAGELIETTRADRQADRFNRMTLLRLLCLLLQGNLPEAILPEKLERALELALPSLPVELAQPLAFHPGQETPPLPQESAVSFHHLLLRLRQINWDRPPDRAVEAINQLLAPLRAESCSFFTRSARPRPLLRIHQDQALLGHPDLYELSDSPPFLASAALLRYVNDSPPAKQYIGNMFAFPDEALPALLVEAKFINRRRVPRAERLRYDALLRTSWPTRRFRLPPETPCWLLECIHLLGLSQPSTELLLEIPTSWLTEPFGESLWELILENFQLLSAGLGEGTTLLELVREKSSSLITTLRSPAGERLIDWNEETDRTRSVLLLGLLLDERLYQLLRSERFQLCPETPTTPLTDCGLQAFSRSALGHCLWTLLGGKEIPATAEELRTQGRQLGWPVPDNDLLYQLGQAQPGDDEKILPPEQLEQLLCKLLELSAPLAISCPQLPRLPGTVPAGRHKAPGQHRAEILQHLSAQGLPDFPEQYLYQQDNRRLTTYRFQPPLRVTSELLGQYELLDGDGNLLNISGEVLVDALSLCAELGRTEVELPDDQHQLAELLDNYRADLRQLRQELNRQAHTRLENPQAAERLARKIWHELNLPAWSWLDR